LAPVAFFLGEALGFLVPEEAFLVVVFFTLGEFAFFLVPEAAFVAFLGEGDLAFLGDLDFLPAGDAERALFLVGLAEGEDEEEEEELVEDVSEDLLSVDSFLAGEADPSVFFFLMVTFLLPAVAVVVDFFFGLAEAFLVVFFFGEGDLVDLVVFFFGLAERPLGFASEEEAFLAFLTGFSERA